MNQCLLTSVSCIILLYDQSTILTSGFGRMLKKKEIPVLSEAKAHLCQY